MKLTAITLTALFLFTSIVAAQIGVGEVFLKPTSVMIEKTAPAKTRDMLGSLVFAAHGLVDINKQSLAEIEREMLKTIKDSLTKFNFKSEALSRTREIHQGIRVIEFLILYQDPDNQKKYNLIIGFGTNKPKGEKAI